jgi:hypothetical protein
MKGFSCYATTANVAARFVYLAPATADISLMDSTLVIVVFVLVVATVLAMMQTRRRDKCLKAFAGFHLTLAEKDGNLSWGSTAVYPTGLEVEFATPVRAPAGHFEHSYIFYKEQYAAMDGLYRYAVGLPDDQQRRRTDVIRKTVDPSATRRAGRKIRNWLGMIRDAVLQVVSVLIGAAKTRAPASAVLSTQEQSIRALSSEIIGHAGNVYDPLLERHLYRQVVVELTRGGRKRSFCGWLKDYSSEFIEVLDAVVNHGPYHALAPHSPGASSIPGVEIRFENHRLAVVNESEQMLFLTEIRRGESVLPMGVVLPVGFTADLRIDAAFGTGASAESIEVWLKTARRIDMVVPRSHALVRHAGSGAETSLYDDERSVVAEAVEARDRRQDVRRGIEPGDAGESGTASESVDRPASEQSVVQ